jgi:8-amino-7-oxononanoate synthase
MNIWQDMQSDLDSLAAADLLRQPVRLDSAAGPRVTVDGRELVCLCSNDYLSLANDPAVRTAAVEAIETWGFGAAASRLVSGTMQPHTQLEQALAAFKQTDDAVITPTGWMANHATIATLAGSGDLILCDKLNHASIIDAASACGARLRTYRHRDVERLEALLRRYRAGHRRCLIVTDSLFSMDGDLAPLGEIVKLKLQYDAQLLIDEAHATGVFGAAGRGAAELLGVEQHVDVTVGTLSKAIGSMGGFIAGPAVLADTIRNTSRAYIYTTAPPPAVCAAAMAGLEIIRTQPRRREELLQKAHCLRQALNDAGLDTGDSASQILPVVIGPAGRAMQVSRDLLAEGFLVPAIRPPTVPKGTSRLRISLCWGHTSEEIGKFHRTLVKILKKTDKM